jgi:hypothetical protein
MPVISAKAATAETVNGLQIDQLGDSINPPDIPETAIFQVLGSATRRQRHRTRLIAAGWVVIRRSDGQRKSVPVFRKCAAPIFKAEAR